MEIFDVQNQCSTPSCLPQILKSGIWERQRGSRLQRKRFILEFQVVNSVCLKKHPVLSLRRSNLQWYQRGIASAKASRDDRSWYFRTDSKS